MALRLHLMGILELQCTGYLFGLLKIYLNIDPFSFSSNNFDGFTSTINLMF